jgi:3-oxoacyl-[acyl-carrier protein] reductase
VRLSGKTAIVTGGASGIGAGIVRRFVAEGARVAIADLNAAAAAALAAELGAGALPFAVDVASGGSVAALAAAAAAALGPIDILVNNAGVGHVPQPLEELAETDFERVLAVNVRSIYLTARAFVPAMKARRRGAILNIASTAGVSPRPRLTWYNASKGWVITATRSMAVELAPFGVRVNALNPVASETPLLATFMGTDTPETRARFLASIPLGRFATPEDMGHAAVYLCSDEASMVTGVTLEVDGGRCI